MGLADSRGSERWRERLRSTTRAVLLTRQERHTAGMKDETLRRWSQSKPCPRRGEASRSRDCGLALAQGERAGLNGETPPMAHRVGLEE